MLPADDYQRIYHAHGKAAADAEFDRQMRRQNVRLIVAGIVLVLLVIATISTIP